MKLRKSALTSLVLGLALIGSACESETDVTPPPATPTISITPSAPITLAVGQQATVTAVVTGLNTNAVTFTSSVPAVATVDASTGVVSAVAPGTTTIVAASTEQSNLRASVQVTVTGGDTGGDPVPPTLSVSRITQGNTNAPVNINNVMGQIDVVLNVDVPQGNAVDELNVTFTQDGVTESRTCQTFTGGAAEALAVAGAAQAEVVCSYDTGAWDMDTGEVDFQNGPITVSGQLVMADGDVVNANNQITIVLNNNNFVWATPTWSRGCANSEAAGVDANNTRWCGGDLTLDLLQVNYDGDGFDVNSVTATIATVASTGGAVQHGANGTCAFNTLGANCAGAVATRTDNTADGNAFQLVFPGGTGVTTTTANDIAGVESVVNITITSGTTGGEAGPVCINPDAAGNPQNTCGVASPNLAFFPTPVRIDNLAPRVTLFDITPATLGCTQSACFVNEDFAFAAAAPLMTLVDFGVDAQTATFFAGTSSTTLREIRTGAVDADGAAFGETATPTLFLQARVEDKLDNTRSVYAGTTATAPTTSTTGAQRFGIDTTDPTIEGVTPDIDGDTDPAGDVAAEVITITFEDAGTGPSGFTATPVSAILERILASGTTCYNPNTGVALANCTSPVVATGGTVTIPDLDGYWQLTVFVTDAAGNESDTEVFLYLDDEVPPTVAGVVAPSTINGGTSVTFSADASDNVELGDVLSAIGYGALGVYAHEPREEIDDYGVDSFTTSTVATFTYDYFIHQLESTAAGAPAGNATQADVAEFLVRDVAGVELGDACPLPTAADGATTANCTLRKNNNIVVNVQAGEGTTPTPWSTIDPDLVSFVLTVDRPAPDVSAGQSATWTATATGPQGTFAEPFEFVNFYQADASGRYVLVSSDQTGTATDDDIQNNRRWTYSGPVFTPTAAGQTRTYRAVGVVGGAGLVSNDATSTSVL